MGKSLQYYQKKFNRQLICNKNYLKAEKKNQHKRRLSLYLQTSNIDWFSLQTKWKLLL